MSTRGAFMLAMGLFSGGTLLAALAPGFLVLLLARIVQAGGTAIMLPLLMTTILTLVPMSKRGAVMGNVSIAISVAPAMGPTVSGIILDTSPGASCSCSCCRSPWRPSRSAPSTSPTWGSARRPRWTFLP